MLSRWESEVKCEIFGKILRKISWWDIVNYTPVSFWHEKLQYIGRLKKNVFSMLRIVKKFIIFMCIFCCKHVYRRGWFKNCIKEQNLKKQTNKWLYSVGTDDFTSDDRKNLSLVLLHQKWNYFRIWHILFYLMA